MAEFTSHAPGTPSWTDLMSPDVDAAVAFYTAVFGWDAEDQFDDNGNRTRYIDAEDNSIQYQYDDMDRPVGITDHDGRDSSVNWDPLGRFASKTDRTGATVSNGYDGQDRITSVIDAEGRSDRVEIWID